MFQKWGIIGDSFASGVFVKASTGAIDNHLQKSWPQILARKAGNQCVNFSMGGLYCGSWLTNTDRGLPFMLSEPAKELYIIALGINDVARLSGVQPLGTISDINEDYSQNPSTFFGNYGKIIGNVQTHAPNAKIILSTIPYTFTEATSINNAILAIAEHFGLPCLPVHTDKFFRSSYFWANFEQDHPKSFLYSAMANAYNRLICDSLRDDTSYWGDTFN
jgi:lysophospholipase L1-like esterase